MMMDSRPETITAQSFILPRMMMIARSARRTECAVLSIDASAEHEKAPSRERGEGPFRVPVDRDHHHPPIAGD
jgi:hypothetical protein